MKTFQKRLSVLEDEYKETGVRIALIANDADREESLRQVKEIHDNGPNKAMNLISVFVHPSQVTQACKFMYSNDEEENISA